VAYDSRRCSRNLRSKRRSSAANGIKAHLFESLRRRRCCRLPSGRLGSTPASSSRRHNPPGYNGYKVYGPDGCQLSPQRRDRLPTHRTGRHPRRRQNADERKRAAGPARYIGEEIDRAYLDAVAGIEPGGRRGRAFIASSIRRCTARGVPVTAALGALGFENVFPWTVRRSRTRFPDVNTPDPADRAVYARPSSWRRMKKARPHLATDPTGPARRGCEK
jgi:phosphoglucomutase